MPNITIKDTLLQITDKYPTTIDIFVSKGFPQIGDESKRKSFGTITLEMALRVKGLDSTSFIKVLNDSINSNNDSTDNSMDKTTTDNANNLHIVGLLPCPVRVPLLDSFEKFKTSYENNNDTTISYELQAASMGLDWVQKNLTEIKSAEALPDLFISAGFDMFFNKDGIGKYKDEGIFKDIAPIDKFNSSFNSINLKDPKGHYSMIGVVPAVFLINTDELKGRDVPQSWEDILSPEFEKSVSLPVGDFDLFNGILLNIHKKYGDDGVKKLSKSLLESLHPSQMVKSEIKSYNKPCVTIMPYFFTRMVKEGSIMQAVWPSDGAIISPIFMLSKSNNLEKMQPIVDFFSSEEVGEILSHKGLFPTVHPDVDNNLKNKNFMWLEWDYIYSQNIGELIDHCLNVFENNKEA